MLLGIFHSLVQRNSRWPPVNSVSTVRSDVLLTCMPLPGTFTSFSRHDTGLCDQPCRRDQDPVAIVLSYFSWVWQTTRARTTTPQTITVTLPIPARRMMSSAQPPKRRGLLSIPSLLSTKIDGTVFASRTSQIGRENWYVICRSISEYCNASANS